MATDQIGKEERLNKEIDELRERLEESEAVIAAIREGGVDAVVVYHPSEQVYTLKGADYSYRVLIEAISEGAVVISASGMIAYCNAPVRRDAQDNSPGPHGIFPFQLHGTGRSGRL